MNKRINEPSCHKKIGKIRVDLFFYISKPTS